MLQLKKYRYQVLKLKNTRLKVSNIILFAVKDLFTKHLASYGYILEKL